MSSPVLTGPATGGEHASPPVAGLDLLTRHPRDADTVVHRLVGLLADDPRSAGWPAAVVAATHVAGAVGGSGDRHVTVSVAVPAAPDVAWPVLADAFEVLRAGLAVPGDAALVLGERSLGGESHAVCAALAASEQATRAGGRVVHYPGVEALTGYLTVSELLDRSAVESVRVLAAGEAAPDAGLLTRDFVRPVWAGGRLVLHVQPAAGGVLVPFEVPDPTPCCEDHA